MKRRADLPAGTVTLLFSDIEGSTRLLEERGAAYDALLREHRATLRRAFAGHGGAEVDTQGDAFFYAFASAREAALAALEAQAALRDGPVRVRIGLHTGEPRATEEGYVGIDVHRAARIMSAGHGGQIVASQATRDLLDGVAVTDLGEHRLKDLSGPQRLWQLGEGRFPRLRTLHQTNLPVLVSPLVGRERELSEAATLVRRDRVVTLTGPGGSGKTRLALQLAADLVEEFPDGVWWVPLAAVVDPELVMPSVAQALGTPGDVAVSHRTKRALVVLDNLEQVIDCAPRIAELLAATEQLRVVATSREPLRIAAEREYPVEPMDEDEAVALFGERGEVGASVDVVRRICRRLDCLPLAIELAAARTSILDPMELLARLDDALGVLTTNRRDAPERQRTLRATIEWSHGLLSDEERSLFRRLAVFAGGFTLPTAEAVVGADLDVLQALVERSLVRRWASGRFAMLETIREFARQQLEADPAVAALRDAHLDHFLELALAAEPALRSDRQVEHLDRLEQELPNVREAIAWSLRTGRADAALRLCAALGGFWMYHSHLTEGRRWVAAALEADVADPDREGEARDRLRSQALGVGSVLATLQGDMTAAEDRARQRLEIGRRIQDELEISGALLLLGRPTLARGDVAGARAVLEEGRGIADAAGERFTAAMATFNLAYVSLSAGDFDRARAEMTETLDRFRPLGDAYGVARALTGLGAVAVHADDGPAAIGPLREGLVLLRRLGDREGPAWALDLLGVALVQDDPHAAARLLGAAERLRDELGLGVVASEREPHDRAVGRLASALEPGALDDAWAAGRAMDLAEAIAFALERTDGPAAAGGTAS